MSTIYNNNSRSSAYHYHAIFGDICSTRFQRLMRFVTTSTCALAFVIAIPSSLSWWNLILPFRALLITFGFFLLACLRKNNLHVDFLGYKTLSSQALGQLLSKRFLTTLIFYSISSFLFFATIHLQFNELSLTATPKKHQYPPLNDKYVYYYFNAFFVALSYSLQHSIFDRDSLTFTYGNFHEHPKNALIKTFPSVISNSIIYTVSNVIISPIIYFFARHIIYDIILTTLGLFITLNQSYPSFGASFGFSIKISLITFLLLISWETLNTSFNAYLSIGCLHRGHTLSELSTDPLGTLLTGLKSEKPFTKMTAFQELAYISKIPDSEGRLAIYNRLNRRGNPWLEILSEATNVIKINNSNINRVIFQSETQESQTSTKPIKKEQNIFGREEYTPVVETDLRNDFFYNTTTIEEPQSFIDINIINVVIQNLKTATKLAKEYYYTFVTSGFGIPFRYTVRRESERLCPLPVIVGNAIIAISLLATHAYDEDKKGTVSSTIAEILEILERSVSTCGRFVQNPPNYLVEKNEENIISLLHELSMNAFFEVTLKYKDVLRDIVLPPDVFRLANWSLEQAYQEDL